MTNAEARFSKSHIRKVYACLAVTCRLHFWQNDRDLLLRATVVTRGWNGYRNKSQHRKSTLEKKILPPFQQGFEPATFQSRVRRSNHWAIPAPLVLGCRADIFIGTTIPEWGRLQPLLLGGYSTESTMVCACGEEPGVGWGERILSALDLFFGKVWSNTNSRSGWWEMSESNQ